jgi:hypothetical protein
MFKIINGFGWFTLGCILYVLMQMMIDKGNPCSSFSESPQDCSSDLQKDLVEE